MRGRWYVSLFTDMVILWRAPWVHFRKEVFISPPASPWRIASPEESSCTRSQPSQSSPQAGKDWCEDRPVQSNPFLISPIGLAEACFHDDCTTAQLLPLFTPSLLQVSIPRAPPNKPPPLSLLPGNPTLPPPWSLGGPRRWVWGDRRRTRWSAGVFSSLSCFATSRLCDLKKPFVLSGPRFLHLYQEKDLD